MTDCSLIIAQVGSASALFHVNPCLMNNGHCAKDRLDKHVMQFQLIIAWSKFGDTKQQRAEVSWVETLD
jgi:uncharacterized metal-binding protein